jgi:hypothetical protein
MVKWHFPDITYYKQDSNQANEQMVAWNAANLWWYESSVDNITGLIIVGEYNPHTTHSGIPGMRYACAKLLAICYAMFVHTFTLHVVKTTQILGWW